MYKKALKFKNDGSGLENPMTKRKKGCPYDCGLCNEHLTTTVLANIDITNRCNMHCPICFANAEAKGYVYEPTKEEIINMMKVLRSEKPAPAYALQFSGGEPTLREDLPELIKLAKEFGFPQVQIATNGIKIAESREYAKKLKDAGLNTVYLQFDGLKRETYIATRGFNALPFKLKAIENCRKVGLKSIVLVPTLCKGINDDQVGDIIRFAAENIDVVRGVNVQPVSFSGRIDKEELSKMRITLPDFVRLVEEQTNGEITKEDFYPVPFTVPVTKFLEAWQNCSKVKGTVHPHCGVATYAVVEDGKLIPLTRFADVEAFYYLLMESIEKINSGRIGKVEAVTKIIRKLPRIIDKNKQPKSLNLLKIISEVLHKGTHEAAAEFHRHLLFIGGMHFMDAYNFDIERVQRCAIHYALPDGRVIPFCSYNTIHREKFEKEHSMPIR